LERIREKFSNHSHYFPGYEPQNQLSGF